MEQNKVLMVIVSVAIFFLAIIGVGVALLYPRDGEISEAASGSVAREFDPIEYVRRPERAPLEEEQDGEDPVIIVYGDDQPSDADLSAVTDGDPAMQQGEDAPRVETQPAEPQASPERPVTITERPARRQDPEPVETRARETTSAPEPQQRQPQPAHDTAVGRRAEPQPRQIRVTEYWIQLIASPSRDRVEQARAVLSDYSLGGRVTTRDVDGRLFYRLRVGPYESKDEADKFLEWIRDIDGFGEAYVSEEYPLRTVRS